MAKLYLLFRSTHETLKAESILKAAGHPCKVVMKPSGIRSDCGLAVRTEEGAEAVLAAGGLTPRSRHEL